MAEKYRAFGIEVFVFGSFAWGDHRPNSDLDLGVEWQNGRSADLWRGLLRDVDDLPTVRKIDLVDFSRAAPEWRSIARRDRQFLF